MEAKEEETVSTMIRKPTCGEVGMKGEADLGPKQLEATCCLVS